MLYPYNDLNKSFFTSIVTNLQALLCNQSSLMNAYHSLIHSLLTAIMFTLYLLAEAELSMIKYCTIIFSIL